MVSQSPRSNRSTDTVRHLTFPFAFVFIITLFGLGWLLRIVASGLLTGTSTVPFSNGRQKNAKRLRTPWGGLVITNVVDNGLQDSQVPSAPVAIQSQDISQFQPGQVKLGLSGYAENDPITNKDAGRIHVFYYSWYGAPSGRLESRWVHWNHAVLGHWTQQVNDQYRHIIGRVYSPPDEVGANFYPLDGPYSSSSMETLHRHAQQMREAKIDVAVLSWYPPHLADENGVKILADTLVNDILDVFAKYSVQVAFHVEPYKGRTAESVWQDAEYLNLRYGTHPGLAKYKGKPILYIYDSYLINANEWKRIGIEKQKNSFVFGLVVEEKHLNELADSKFFDGVYTYFAAEGFVWSSSKSNWRRIVDFAHMRSLVASISVGPGYEDTKIRPWNGINSRGREDGHYYEQAFQAAYQAKTDFLSITSFNEWHEGTQIEPASKKSGYLDYGDDPMKYLKLTREFVCIYFGGASRSS